MTNGADGIRLPVEGESMTKITIEHEHGGGEGTKLTPRRFHDARKKVIEAMHRSGASGKEIRKALQDIDKSYEDAALSVTA